MSAGTTKERALVIIETLFQQLIAVFVLLVLWEVFKNFTFNNRDAWHIILCTIGTGLLMAEGLLLFNKENTFLKDADRPKRGTVHAIVMILSFVCNTIGIALKIDSRVIANQKHFTTTHSILGLTAWILITISLIVGALAGSAKKFSSLGRPSLYKILHLLLGVITYIIGVVALGFGLNYLVWYNGRNVLIVFLALYVAYSLVGAVKTCYNHFFG